MVVIFAVVWVYFLYTLSCLYLFISGTYNAVNLSVAATDVISIHKNLAAMETIVADELSALCMENPTPCCAINNDDWWVQWFTI